MRRFLPLLIVATALVAHGAFLPSWAAAGPEWEIEFLPADPAWHFSNPTEINQRGWISGTAGKTSTGLRPVLWRGDGFVDLLTEFPGAEGFTWGQASTINDAGWLGGVVRGAPGTPQYAALWDGKKEQAYIVHPDAADVPGYSFTHSQIMDLNDRGEAAGMVRNFPGGVYQSERAYVWGRYGGPGTLLPIPAGYVSSQAISLNDRGVVAGTVWDGFFDLEACAWVRRCHGEYEFVHIQEMLADFDPAIVRSFTLHVDDRGRVYGVGQAAGFLSMWTFVWEDGKGVRFLDTDGSVGQVWGGGGKVLAGFREELGGGGEVALAWLHETPYVLPELPDHGGHVGVGANARGDVVGYAMRPGAEVWHEGSDAWIARRARGCDDK
jgi:hypothetical protein